MFKPIFATILLFLWYFFQLVDIESLTVLLFSSRLVLLVCHLLLLLMLLRLLLNILRSIYKRRGRMLVHGLSLKLLVLLKKHLIIHLLVLLLIDINHDLVCLIHALVNNHLLWVYWLIYHDGLWHRLGSIVSIIHKLSLLQSVITICHIHQFVIASISCRQFWLLRALWDFVVHRSTFEKMALTALRFVASISSTTSCSVVLRWAFSLTCTNFLILRLFRYLMVWIHITTLNRMKLILLRISLLVVLCHHLPLKSWFWSLIFLKTNKSVCLA